MHSMLSTVESEAVRDSAALITKLTQGVLEKERHGMGYPKSTPASHTTPKAHEGGAKMDKAQALKQHWSKPIKHLLVRKGCAKQKQWGRSPAFSLSQKHPKSNSGSLT